jgi:hypothetical protein
MYQDAENQIGYRCEWADFDTIQYWDNVMVTLWNSPQGLYYYRCKCYFSGDSFIGIGVIFENETAPL